MMTRATIPSPLLVAYLLIANVGCSHVMQVTAPEDANSRLRHRTAHVLLKNGDYQKVTNALVSSDSLSWDGPPNSDRVYVPLSLVRHISIRAPIRGAVQGFGAGLLWGFGFGAAIGYATGDDSFFTAGNKAAILGLYGAIIGGIVGIPVGALMADEQLIFDNK